MKRVIGEKNPHYEFGRDTQEEFQNSKKKKIEKHKRK